MPAAEMGPPEQQAQEQAMKNAMLDMQHLAHKLRPMPEDPDAVVAHEAVIQALVSAPSFQELSEDDDGGDAYDDMPKIEAILNDCAAFGEDGAALKDLEGTPRRNAILLYYKLNQQRPKLEAAGLQLAEETECRASAALQKATKMLVQSQMLMPQQRWVQATLGVAKASALVANSLWSHADEEAQALMGTILKSEGLRLPRLSLRAAAAASGGEIELDPESCAACSEVLAGGKVDIRVCLSRDHAGADGVVTQCSNPQGIWEAYWCYVEGHKPKGTPNSLLAAQPMVVTDLDQADVEARITFGAPPTEGSYRLTVHIVSTSVIGVDLAADVTFKVVADDVPDLA